VKDEIDYSELIPEDLLEEIRRYEREEKSKEKVQFPSSRDIVEAMKAASLVSKGGIHPDEFPEVVANMLREKGFDTRFVSAKRVWKVYENLVERGIIPECFRCSSEEEGISWRVKIPLSFKTAEFFDEPACSTG